MQDIRQLTQRLLAGRAPLPVAGGIAGGVARVPAAVLLLLYERDGREHVLLHRRAATVRHHRGEIAMPGGRHVPADGSLLDTALRETEEEIGVVRPDIDVLGALDHAATQSSNFLIVPFVGAIARPGLYPPGAYPFRLDHREVAELLDVPLEHLLDERHVSWSVREVEGERAAERAFHYGEHRIWGATARILGQYVDLLRATGLP